jgi:hypothetical protein
MRERGEVHRSFTVGLASDKSPVGATWLALRDDEDDPGRGEGPEPTFGFGEPPVSEGAWEKPGY